jgi:chromosome segregation ATPase
LKDFENKFQEKNDLLAKQDFQIKELQQGFEEKLREAEVSSQSSISQERAQIVKLQKETESKDQRLDLLSKELDVLQKDLKTKTALLEEKDKQFSQVKEAQQAGLKQAKQEAKSSAKEERVQVRNLEREVKNKSRELDRLNTEFAKLRDQLKEKELLVREQDDRIKVFEQQDFQARQKKESDVSKAAGELKRLEESLAQSNREIEKQKDALLQKEQEIAQLKAVQQGSRDQASALTRAQGDIARIQKEVEEKVEIVTQRDAAMVTLEKRLQEAEARAKQQMDNVGEYEQKMILVEKDVDHKAKELDRLQKETDSLKKDLVVQQSLVKTKETRLADLEQKLQIMEADNGKKTEILTRQEKDRVKSLEKEVEKKNVEVARLQSDLTQAQDVLAKKSAVVEEGENKVKELEKFLKEKTEALRKAEDNKAESETVVKLELESRQKDQQIVKLNTEIQSLNRDFQEKISFLETKDKEWADKEKALREQVEKARKEFQENGETAALERSRVLEKSVEEKDQEIIRLIQEISDFKSQFEQKETSLKETQQRLQAAEQSLQEVTAKDDKIRIEKLNKEMARMKDEMDLKRALLIEKDQEIVALEKHRKDTERLWQETKIDYENRIKAMEGEFNKFKSQTSDVDDQHKRTIRNLEDDLRKLRIEMGYSKNKKLFSDYKLEHREKEIEEKHSLLKRKDQLIIELKEKLLDAQKEIGRLQGSDKGVDDPVAMKNKANELTLQIEKKEEFIKERNEAYWLLEERFKDAQQRLEFVDKLMKEKDDQIKDLEQQLNEVITKLGG